MKLHEMDHELYILQVRHDQYKKEMDEMIEISKILMGQKFKEDFAYLCDKTNKVAKEIKELKEKIELKRGE